MRKAVLFCFLFGLSFTYAQPQLPKTDSLKGNIKSVREKLIFLDEKIQNLKLFSNEDEYGHHGFLSREFTLGRFEYWWYTLPWAHYVNYYREYDQNQNIVLETWFYKDETFLEEYRFKYDEKNNLIERQEYWDSDELHSYERYSYDHFNRKTSEIRFVPDDINFYSYRCFFYDKKDRLIEKINFGEEGYKSTIEFKYNEADKIISETVYRLVKRKPADETKTKYYQDTLTHKSSQINYIYDQYFNLIQKDIYSYKNSESSPKMYVERRQEYDSKNRLIKIIFPDEDDSIRTYVVYEYLKDTNFKTKESHISPEFPDSYSVVEYFYDKNKRVIKLIYEEDHKTDIAEFEYKFDEKGNWYEQLKTVNGKPLYLRKREIVYY